MIIGEHCTCRVCGWNRSAGRNLDVPKPNQVVNPYTLSIPAKTFTFTTSGYSVVSTPWDMRSPIYEAWRSARADAHWAASVNSPTPWSYGPTIT